MLRKQLKHINKHYGHTIKTISLKVAPFGRYVIKVCLFKLKLQLCKTVSISCQLQISLSRHCKQVRMCANATMPHKRAIQFRGPNFGRFRRVFVTTQALPFAVTATTSDRSLGAVSEKVGELCQPLTQLSLDRPQKVAGKPATCCSTAAQKKTCRNADASEKNRQLEIDKMAREFLKRLPKKGGGFEAAAY